jgi:shikimate kinase
MNKFVFIVGPSGVGKTTASQAVRPEFPEMVFDDLDDLAARWAHSKGLIDRADVQLLNRTLGNADSFLLRGLEALSDVAERNKDRSMVIDVGAGFQDAKGATNLHERHSCVTITATPEVAYKRIREKRNDSRTLQGYMNQEFNQHRISVYDASQHRIDTTSLTIEQTTRRLADLLRQLLGTSAGSNPQGGQGPIATDGFSPPQQSFGHEQDDGQKRSSSMATG